MQCGLSAPGWGEGLARQGFGLRGDGGGVALGPRSAPGILAQGGGPRPRAAPAASAAPAGGGSGEGGGG